MNFQKENNVVFIEEQSSSSATYLVGLNNELAHLIRERDLLAMENKGDAPDSPLMPAPPRCRRGHDRKHQCAAPTSSGNRANDNANQKNSDAITTEQDDIEKLKIQRDEYGIYLKDKHPKMIDLAEQIDRGEKFLEVLKTNDLKTHEEHRVELDLQIENLNKQIEEWSKKSLEISERLGAYEQIKNQITREQTLYNQLASGIQNVNLNKSLDQENIVILEAASPAVPVNPNLSLQMLGGLGGGLLTGIIIIYFVRRLDDRIDSPTEFERKCGIPAHRPDSPGCRG